jgi:hypothetical protein
MKYIGHPLHQGRLLVLISVNGRVKPRATAQLGGLGQLKNPLQDKYTLILYHTTYLSEGSGSLLVRACDRPADMCKW